MKTILSVSLLLSIFLINAQPKTDYIELSQNLLKKVKKNQDVQDEVKKLETTTLEDLTEKIKTDQQKLAFWINIYNAFIQISLKENPEQYSDENRDDFFKTERVNIAGEKLSFDDIEHGIIRSSMSKISMGYVKKIFRPEWEKKLRVENIDWRIHFALNCGAKSCPPVAIYNDEVLDQQLDFMTKSYLKEQTDYNEETKTAHTVVLFSWFRGDFGGLDGAREILKEYGITPVVPDDLEFKDYDWTMLIDNYRELPEF